MGQRSRSRQVSSLGTTGAAGPRALAGALAAAVALLAAPAIAQAAVGASAGAATAAAVTVGQTGVPASITLTNTNTGLEAGATNSICNAGEAAPCLGAAENGISYLPSCAMAPGGICNAGAAEAGVFQVSPVASGRLGSACAGAAFQVAGADAGTGRLRFVPQPAGTHVLLPGAGSSCAIDFTQSVQRTPATDADAVRAGIQTLQIADHTQTSGASTGRGLGSTLVTVQPASPALSTAASPSVAVGGTVTDRATITGLVNPVAVASVTFRLYAPSAGPTCAGAPIFTSSTRVQLAGNTATATSAAYSTTVAGTHRWIATYEGDANNLPIVGACGAPGESVEVTAGGGGTGTPPFPAKLEVARALVSSATRRLDVFAPISRRASGRVTVRLQSAGRTTSFTAPVDSAHARVLIDRPIPAAQARVATGILTLVYPGDADTQPQEVRLRAAPRKALLVARRPTISGGRLLASGRISTLARGVVRVQLLFEPAGEGTRTLQLSAPIEGGGYRLNAALAPDVLAQIAGRRGVVHSYTLFTGYALARMRGEMASFEVLPAP